MSMNMIRHISESHIIQLSNYSKLTNREKNDLHAKLLHSTMAANTSYNKIANRANAPEFAFKHDDEPPAKAAIPTKAPMPVAMTKSGSPLRGSEPFVRSKGRRKRIFHGDFTPSGSDKTLEIDIFEK
ncbi:unnamed protein product [Phytophthora lilii]|uniref:Unnamed protein product n=1 Tax=Phytophthora lilii TaxID=2077276 RepID=A0A9W7D9T9_9STRA|nr:unnamed protein product [Phytophthora lilii]